MKLDETEGNPKRLRISEINFILKKVGSSPSERILNCLRPYKILSPRILSPLIYI